MILRPTPAFSRAARRALCAAVLFAIPCVSAAAAPGSKVAPPEKSAEARALLEAGDCAGALAKSTPLLAKYPDDVELLITEANCRMRQARRDDEQVFDAMQAERQRVLFGNTFSRAAATSTYTTRRRYDAAERDRAIAQLQRAQKIAPDREDLFVGTVAAMVHADLVADALRALSARQAPLSPDALNDIAALVDDLLAAGQRADAASLAGAFAAAFPGTAAGFRAQGAVALAAGDAPRAIEHFSAAYGLSQRDVGLARQLASLLMMSRRYEAALTITGAHAGSGEEFLFWLALARTRTNDKAALPIWSQFKAVLMRSQNPPQAMARLADHYTRVIGDGKPVTEAMHLAASNRFLEWNMPVAAVAELDAVLRSNPRSIVGWKRLADLYRAQRAPGFALEALDKALEFAQTAPAGAEFSAAELQQERGRVLFGLGRDREALDALRAARAGGHPAPYIEAGALLATGGAKADVLKLLGEAEASGGEMAEWATARIKLLTEPPVPPAP